MAIKIKDISGIGVAASSETWVTARFRTPEGRYHFRLNKEGEPEDLLYKNSHAEFGKPGYKSCISTKLTAKSNAAALAHVMDLIRSEDLYAVAVQAYKDEVAAKHAHKEAARAVDVKQAYERWMHLRANEGLHPGDADFTQQVSQADWLALSDLILSGSRR